MPDLDALPLKPIEVHILLVLADGDRHGYGIVKEIEVRSEGRIRLEPGNLYRHVRRLVDAGWVAPAERRATDDDTSPRRRRYYRITGAGRRILAAEGARMRRLADAVEEGLRGA